MLVILNRKKNYIWKCFTHYEVFWRRRWNEEDETNLRNSFKKNSRILETFGDTLIQMKNVKVLRQCFFKRNSEIQRRKQSEGDDLRKACSEAKGHLNKSRCKYKTWVWVMGNDLKWSSETCPQKWQMWEMMIYLWHKCKARRTKVVRFKMQHVNT